MSYKWWDPFRLLRGGKKKPRVNDSPYAWPRRWQARLELTQLEKRTLFAAPVVQQAPFLYGAGAAFDQNQWLAPIPSFVSPFNDSSGGLGQPTVTSSGTYTFDEAGYYTFTLHLTGGTASDRITFDESGTVSSSYTEWGSVSNGVRTADYIYGAWSGSAVWTWTRVMFNGMFTITQNQSGTDAPGLNERGLDYTTWRSSQWKALLSHASDTNGLGLFNYSWDSLTVDETGGYSFTYQESGLTTATLSNASYPGVDGLNSAPGGVPLLVPTGQRGGDSTTNGGVGFSCCGREAYTSVARAVDTLHLHAEGTRNNTSGYSLSCVLYTDNGVGTYAYAASGNGTVSGSGTALTTTLFGSGFLSGSGVQTNAFNYVSTGSFSTNENGTFAYTIREAGTYGNSSYNLGSVLYTLAGSGVYQFANDGTTTYSGTLTDSGNYAGSQGNPTG